MREAGEMTEAEREYLECIGVAVDAEPVKVAADWRERYELTDEELRREKILSAAE